MSYYHNGLCIENMVCVDFLFLEGHLLNFRAIIQIMWKFMKQ